MKTSHKYLLIACLLAWGAALLTDALAQEDKAAASLSSGATRVAVCDVVQIFDNYERAKTLNATLNERKRSVDQENDKRGKEIDEISRELEGLKEGSKEYESRFIEQSRLSAERDAWLRLQNLLILREHHRLSTEMYEQIMDTIRDVAKSKGYHLVLFRDQEELMSQNSAELVREIAQRRVLYADPRIDITDEVLLRLNADYRASGN